MSFDPGNAPGVIRPRTTRHPEDSNQKNIDSKYNVAVLVTGDVGAYRIPRYTQAGEEKKSQKCRE